MDIIKRIVSQGLVFVLAVAILGTGALVSGDNNAVEAEKLATVYLTNKGTGYTTEASPPSSRTAPASRKNASTVYVNSEQGGFYRSSKHSAELIIENYNEFFGLDFVFSDIKSLSKYFSVSLKSRLVVSIFFGL